MYMHSCAAKLKLAMKEHKRTDVSEHAAGHDEPTDVSEHAAGQDEPTDVSRPI